MGWRYRPGRSLARKIDVPGRRVRRPCRALESVDDLQEVSLRRLPPALLDNLVEGMRHDPDGRARDGDRVFAGFIDCLGRLPSKSEVVAPMPQEPDALPRRDNGELVKAAVEDGCRIEGLGPAFMGQVGEPIVAVRLRLAKNGSDIGSPPVTAVRGNDGKPAPHSGAVCSMSPPEEEQGCACG